MSRSADVCLYVLALQDGLLKEDELDGLLQRADEKGLSLKNMLTSRCDGERLDELLRKRLQYAARCGACKLTTYVLPSQDRTCEHCKGPLPEPGEAPPHHAPAEEARLRSLQRAGTGLGVDATAPPVVPPPARFAPPPPVRPVAAPAAPPTAAGVAGEVLKAIAERLVQDARLVAALGGLVLLAMVVFGFTRMLRRLPWHVNDAVSVNAASHHKRLRVVYVTNPTDPDCKRFFKEVLEDDRVLALGEELVWQLDMATDKNSKDRSDHLFGVPQGPSRLPWILIYNQSAEVTDGILGAREMTCEGFLAMIDRSKKDPRPIAARLGTQ